MRFLLSEYINLLKEDGELDTLLTDLLIGMKLVLLSKPQRGRQNGVDIAATGIDKTDGKKKIFLLAVKRGNLTRRTWDGDVNAVRASLNQIKDVYIPITLTKNQKKLPVKIIVATNGVINQNVLVDWSRYVDLNTSKNVEYEFWGTGELSAMLDEYLVGEKLFPEEYQSLLRKTLAFLDLPDYDLSHFYKLLELILSKQFTQKKRILKKTRLVRLCLNIIYKWSEDIDNLKPAFFASEKALLLCWNYLQSGNHLQKDFARIEFYQLHQLKRKIGVEYFNKVHKHYLVDYSLYRYSKNSLEYSLNVWQEIGILATIGLTEIQEFRIYHQEGHKDQAEKHYKSAVSIGNALGFFIEKNPPSHYPDYDEHCIEIALTLNLFYITRNSERAKKWIGDITLGLSDRYHIHTFFPLFRASYDKLVDIHNEDDKCEVESSMIVPILAEYSLVFKDEKLYQFIRKVIGDLPEDLNLQIWFPTEDMENEICVQDYSHGLGKLKHSLTLYEDVEAYKKEVVLEVEMFSAEKKFEIFKSGFDIVAYVASRHYRSQPFPATWRIYFKNGTTETASDNTDGQA